MQLGGIMPFEAAIQWVRLVLKRACKTRHMRNTIKVHTHYTRVDAEELLLLRQIMRTRQHTQIWLVNRGGRC